LARPVEIDLHRAATVGVRLAVDADQFTVGVEVDPANLRIRKRADVQTRIDLTTFEPDGSPRHHYTDFQQASYKMTATGTLELVMRSEQPSSLDPTQTISQVLYLKSFWTPKPGTTHVEASLINTRVRYALLTPPTGVCYHGGAFVSYKLDRPSGVLTGVIESGTLAPRFRMGDAATPFGPARFTGTFRATENPRDVVAAIQMLDTRFDRPARAQNRQPPGSPAP
jgi:hypothetical protein